MLSMETLVAFLAASVLITLAPGPDNLMVLSLGMSRGRAAGIGFGLGCAAGCATHTLWATLGIGALVLASDYAFAALKLAGAAYLIYIGILSWRHAGQAALSHVDASDASMWLYVRRGFVANAINPKVALFFVAFLPQFADTSSAPASMVWLQMLLLGAVFGLQTVVVFGALGWFSGRIGEHLQHRPRIAFWLDRVAGLVFIALAMRLALATR